VRTIRGEFMIFKKRKLVLFVLVPIMLFQISSPSFSAESKLNAKQIATVKSLFSDLASSQPSVINKAKKYVAKNSAADKYVDLILKLEINMEMFRN
jgi:hypothetical protein